MSRIFLSYVREDLQSARVIYNLLVENHLPVWMDEKDLLPGQDWKLSIEKAITTCDIFLACLSNKSVSKDGYAQKELRIAWDVLNTIPEGKVFIIPIRFDDCPVPSRLEHIHRLDFFELGSKELLLKAIFAHPKISDMLDNTQPAIRQAINPFVDIPMPKRKKTFTQLEKDRFGKEAFDYIQQYFQRGLQKLEEINEDIETDFNHSGNLEFISKIYVKGNIVCQCQIWLAEEDRFFQHSICYNEGTHISGQRNSLNDYSSIEENDGELYLRIGQMSMGMIKVEQPLVKKEGAAEYLWRRLTYFLK